MNKSNVEYLQRNLKYLGFGTALNEVLRENIAEGKDEFEITTSAQFDNKHSLKNKDNPKDTINYQLNFIKSNITDNYFLNSYNASLEKGRPGKTVDPIGQTFYLNRGNDITAKEAYNLLSGRAVMKNVELAEKLDLITRDREGKAVSEIKVKDLEEAKEKMLSEIKGRGKEKPGSFELQYKGEPVRTFNSEGKSKPLKAEWLELVHHYYNTVTKESLSESFPVENLKSAKELIPKIVKDLAEENQTRDFAIIAANSKVPSYSFDKEGKELNIVPEGRKENIWIKMDFQTPGPKGDIKFRRFYENYGFDLEKELNKLSPVEMKDEQKKERLLGSLQRGNLQLVKLEKDDQRESIYIAANPQFKKLDLYDKELKEVYQSKKEEANNVGEEEALTSRGR